MASPNKHNIFVQDLANKKHDLSADSFKVMFTNTLPTAANAVYADVSAGEVTNGNGYTTGGITPAITSSVQTSGVEKWILAAATLTASGAVGPFRYLILYNSTQTSPLKPLILWFDYGVAVTLANTDTFTYSPDASGGVLTIT